MSFLWITLNVEDLDETLKFYQEIVGMELNKRYKPNEKMEIAFLTDSKSSTQIELISNNAMPFSAVGDDYSLGFECESVDNMVQLAKVKNLQIVSEVLQPNPHIKFFFILDPDGRKVQFVERV